MSCLASTSVVGLRVERLPDEASASMSDHFCALERCGDESHFFCKASTSFLSGSSWRRREELVGVDHGS